MKERKYIKSICLRLLHPGPGWLAALVVLAAGGLIYIFANGLEETPLSYGVYVFSAYTLTAVLCCLPGWLKYGKQKVYANRLSGRLLQDIPFRVKISLYTSLGINLLYALGKLAAGIAYASVWFAAVALYYMVLAVMRFVLLRHMRGENRDICRELRQYRFCGVLLILLSVVLAFMVFQMIWSGEGYAYPGYLIYAMAAYAFYCLIMAVINVVRFRRFNSPALSAAKVVNFAAALVSMFSLQTAMLAAFGSAQEEAFRLMMNILTGSGVCAAIFGVAVYMVVHASRQMQKFMPAPICVPETQIKGGNQDA